LVGRSTGARQDKLQAGWSIRRQQDWHMAFRSLPDLFEGVK